MRESAHHQERWSAHHRGHGTPVDNDAPKAFSCHAALRKPRFLDLKHGETIAPAMMMNIHTRRSTSIPGLQHRTKEGRIVLTREVQAGRPRKPETWQDLPSDTQRAPRCPVPSACPGLLLGECPPSHAEVSLRGPPSPKAFTELTAEFLSSTHGGPNRIIFFETCGYVFYLQASAVSSVSQCRKAKT